MGTRRHGRYGRLVMYHAPNIVFLDETICGYRRVGRQELVADHHREIAMENGYRIAVPHLPGFGMMKDPFPAFHDNITTDKMVPTRMNTADRGIGGPQPVHFLEVAVLEGEVERLVGK